MTRTITVIPKVSVDVIGRKLTAEGNFDLENKKLENLAPLALPGDATYWETVQRIV